MKKIIILISLCLGLFISTSYGQIPNWGFQDTLAHYKLGPGMVYSNIYFQGKKMLIWVVEVDLTNPHNKIEQVQSRHQVPDLIRWTVPEHYKQNSRIGHKVCAAFNHDFFVYESGICIGMNISDGEITYGNGSGRSTLAINKNKKASVFKSSLDARIILPDNSTVKIDYYNRAADYISGECILFNRFNAMELVDEGKYIKISPTSEWTVNGDEITCVVTEISTSPLQSSNNDYIIFLRGSKINSMNNLNLGETIKISQKLIKGTFGDPLTNILNAFHGYPSIAYEGKLHEGEYNNFENGREYEISSRTMAGISEDGNKLYIVTTEMSTSSSGVNCIELAQYMLSIGCWNVVNFDSGGSAAIVIDEVMQNYPARGSIRPVMDALLVVSLAPESSIPNSYCFTKSQIEPVAGTTVPLRLVEYNEYDDIISNDSKGFKFTCIPEELGFVDDFQNLHVGPNAVSGKIIAEKNGITTELIVHPRPITNVFIDADRILIDKRKYKIETKTKIDNIAYDIDSKLFKWEIENTAICNIEDGILQGVSEGETLVTGKFKEFINTFTVKVEIGHDIQVFEDFSLISNFPSKHSGLANIEISNSTNNSDASLGFDFQSARIPYIEFTIERTIYGLPDYLYWKYFNQENIIKELIITSEDSKGNILTKRFESSESAEQNVNFFFETDGKPWEIPHYPIKIKKLRFNLNPTGLKKRYNIGLGRIFAKYPEGTATEIITAPQTQNVNIFQRDKTIIVHLSINCNNPIIVQLFNMDGYLIQNKTFNNLEQVKTDSQIKIENCQPGVYIVRIFSCNEIITRKIIIH